ESSATNRLSASLLPSRHRQIETAPNREAVFRTRLKLTAHQGSVLVDAALRPASKLADQCRTAIAVAEHAPVLEIDQFVRNAFAIAVPDKRWPGFRIGAACAAREAVNGHYYAVTGSERTGFAGLRRGSRARRQGSTNTKSLRCGPAWSRASSSS